MQPFGYTGYQMETAGGLYYAQARRYDAVIGRFTSEDKIRGFLEKPETLNPYDYCWNKPLDQVDLDGMYPLALTGAMPNILSGSSNSTTACVTKELEDNFNSGNQTNSPHAGITEDMDEIMRGEKNPYNPHAGITGDIDKMMNGKSVDTGKGKVKECEKSLWDKFCDYMDKTWDMLIKGNAAEDVTLLGLIAEIVAAYFGVDIILDIRAIIADIYLNVIEEQSGWSIIVDCMWLIPIVGIFKYSDELCALCKKIKCPDWIKKIKKWSGKIDDWEWGKKLKKWFGKGDDVLKNIDIHPELDEVEKFYDDIFEQQRTPCEDYEDYLDEIRKNQSDPYTMPKGDANIVKNNLANKVKDIRAQMPNTNLAKRGNMEMAEVDIPGIKDSFVAHSKINSELDKGADVADFSYLKPENERIFNTYVDDKYPRYHDTEAKILEDIASQITDPNVSGTINLYSELPCCQSCSNIILEFRRMFPNIELNIYVE